MRVRVQAAAHMVSWALLSMVLCSAAMIAVLGSSLTSWASLHSGLTSGGEHHQVSGYQALPCLLWLLLGSASVLLLLIAAGALHRPAGGAA